MKVGQIGPTFVVPGKTVIFLGVKSVVPSSTLKMTKSQKKLIFVTNTTNISGEKFVMWRNFRFLNMIEMEKSEVSPHMEKFLNSPHHRCGQI